jgi:hypothetical protein
MKIWKYWVFKHDLHRHQQDPQMIPFYDTEDADAEIDSLRAANAKLQESLTEARRQSGWLDRDKRRLQEQLDEVLKEFVSLTAEGVRERTETERLRQLVTKLEKDLRQARWVNGVPSSPTSLSDAGMP